MIRVLVVDDHTIFRSGVRRLLLDEADVRVTAEARNGAEALEELRGHACDVVLLDINMEGRSGLEVLASMRAKEPLVRELLYNPQVVDVERVDAALAEKGNADGFRGLLRSASYIIASAMLISAVLNYSFARAIIKSPPDTEAFNQELAKMHWVSLLGLSLPTMAMLMFALWRLFKGISALTGLTMDEILRQPPEEKATTPSN